MEEISRKITAAGTKNIQEQGLLSTRRMRAID